MTALWRQATAAECKSYYRDRFPALRDRLPAHITPDGPKEFALAFREPYPVVGDDIPDRDFIRRPTWQTDDDGEKIRPHFTDWGDLLAFIQSPAAADPFRGTEYGLADPALLDRPAPVVEAVYYALDHWTRPWVLCVDIDAKDVAKQRDQPAETIATDPPSGYAYTFADIERALEYGFEVKHVFESTFGASNVEVVYSGQGCHVYLLDTDPAHRYDEKSREVINDLLQRKWGVPIDPVVTADRSRVMRLPYSLHADVCRVVQPIDSQWFDFRENADPSHVDPTAQDTPGATGAPGDQYGDD